MENNISNEEQIRNKFERIFQYENNKNAFLDYFYGRTNSCPTLKIITELMLKIFLSFILMKILKKKIKKLYQNTLKL